MPHIASDLQRKSGIHRRPSALPKRKVFDPNTGKPQAEMRPPVGQDLIEIADKLTVNQARSGAQRFMDRLKKAGLSVAKDGHIAPAR